jgi:hypothetical protein
MTESARWDDTRLDGPVQLRSHRPPRRPDPVALRSPPDNPA